MARKKVVKKVVEEVEVKKIILSESQMLKIERVHGEVQQNKREVEASRKQIEITRLQANLEIQNQSLKLNSLLEAEKNLNKKHKELLEEIKKELNLKDVNLFRYDPETGEVDCE